MPIVSMPDNTQVSFPDDMPADQIRSLILQKFPDAAKPMSYGEEMGKVASGIGQIGGSIDSLVRQAAKGATFGLADKFAAGMNTLTGNAPSYDEALKKERERTGQFAEANPVTAGLSEAAGGLATGGGLIKSGITLTNIAKNAPLLAKGLLYGTEGAGYGAAQGAGNVDTGKPEDYLAAAGSGATKGAALGVGLPVVGAGAGAAYRTVAPYVSKPLAGLSRGASGLLGMATSADRQGVQNISGLGPSGLLADVGPSFTGLAQGVAGEPSAARSALVNALQSRDVGRSERLAADVTKNLGIAESPTAATKTILDARRVITSPLYEKATANAPPVDTTDVLATIGQKLNTARGAERASLLKARGMLQNESQSGIMTPVTDAETLHNVKTTLDDLINYGDTTLGVPAGALNREQGAVKTIRRQLNDALQKQVPGYAEANAKSAEYAKYAENIETGTSVLDAGKTALWPSDYAQKFSTLTPEGQAATRLGVRGDIENRLGTQANDLAALKKAMGGELDWNRAKMATTFGEQPTANVLGAIGREQQFANTFADVARNSQTQPRAAAAALVSQAAPSNIPLDMTLTGLGGRLGQMLARGAYRSIAGGRSENIRNELGNVLGMKSGPERDALVDALLNRVDATGQTSDKIRQSIGSPALANALLSYGR